MIGNVSLKDLSTAFKAIYPDHSGKGHGIIKRRPTERPNEYAERITCLCGVELTLGGVKVEEYLSQP